MKRWRLVSFLIPFSGILAFWLSCGVPAAKTSVTKKPTGNQIKGLSPRTVRVTVELTYGDIVKEEPNGELVGFFKVLPVVYKVTRETLELAGFEVVESYAEEFDATLQIKAKGSAVAHLYRYQDALGKYYGPATRQYTEAWISGKINFTILDTTHTVTFTGYNQPLAGRVYPYEYVHPDQAPFFEAFLQSYFYPNFAEMFAKKIVPSLCGAEQIEPLVATLKHEGFYFRWEAIKALRNLKDPRAVEALISALKDKSEYIRKEAATALKDLKDPRAIDPMIAALRDEDEGVRKQAQKALKKITGQDLGKDPIQWQHWWEKNKTRYEETAKGK